ncbi:hypothetical protein [Chondrinema litorale]|uniref:hypothetical protein n=1 Tax=Chondrinema litorale TaxID=2994555 RepID=UPI0025428F41|nr:hypothetical protein [Chondrinema litorale]UZR97519.1 hypothetical protein OQ292_27310 [Chondrinema litorale]
MNFKVRIKSISSSIFFLCFICFFIYNIPIIEYADIPFSYKGSRYGREKNGLAIITASLVANKISANSQFDCEVIKSFYPDSKIEGMISDEMIEAKMDLFFSENSLNLEKKIDQKLEGNVDKNGFDWLVEEDSSNNFTIRRQLLKVDINLELEISDGQISGVVKRPSGFDWDLKGHYTNNGDFYITFDCPFSLDIGLRGHCF